MRTFRIELLHLPDPDLNPNKRLHYMALYRAKQAATDEVMALVLAQGRPDRAFNKAHIIITFIAKGKRKRDLDNLMSSMKASLDGLVHAGVLVDDDADHVSYTILFERGDADNTIIEVKEVI
jgi:Holliday junction resolvase RusA-like endonuclease